MPKNPKRVLLIDGDVICYRIALTAQVAMNWADEGQPDLWTAWFKEEETAHRFRATIENLKEKLDADYAILALTDTNNWRYDVMPDYKSNRKLVPKPLALRFLREHATDAWGAYLKPWLEGDDILGMLATKPDFLPKTDKIIVTIDKDLKTIPGRHYHMDKPDLGIFEVNEEEADYWHLYQTLTGDKTDGYPGCPGVGPAKAERFLKEKLAAEITEHVLKRGPRAGQTEKRIVEVPATSPWHTVKSLYEAHGFTEEAALQQARVARILRSSDYDYRNKEPILWEYPRPTAPSAE